MLAILYLAGMIYFGDCLVRRFYRFTSASHRFATAFLVGLLLSSCLTYLGALAFSFTSYSLLFGNIVFLIILVLTARFLPRPTSDYVNSKIERPPGDDNWDLLVIGICVIFGFWLFFSTLNYQDGDIQFAFRSWSDFGANLSLTQSFALGNNFPSEHPFLPGEPLRYHFLFWFQSANFSYLGINSIWAINLLSVLSLLALLILIQIFTESLFGSRVAGRIAVILFFFPATSLAYIPFLYSQESFGEAITKIIGANQFLPTGYPFRGEDWGALTVAVYANQRQLISGAGILFIVLIYLIDLYRYNTAANLEAVSPAVDEIEPKSETEFPNNSEEKIPNETETTAANQSESLFETNEEFTPETDETDLLNVESENLSQNDNQEIETAPRENFRSQIGTLLFCGFLIGALPYWNSAIFVAASIMLASLFIFLPNRRSIAVIIGAVILVGLPQILLLRSGNIAPNTFSLFHWGFTVQNPTVPLVAEYIGWTFGFKWILLLIAFWFSTNFQRRLLLASLGLLAVVFLLQLSTDVFNNHKLLNIWNVLAGIYAAYALWQIGKTGIFRAVLATVLALAMISTSIIDFFPVFNDAKIVIPYKNDRLTNWLLQNTKPNDIFLSQTFLTHPILFTGRRVYLGNTLYAWGTGYNVGVRETKFRRMFQERDFEELVRLLHENKIAYVAIEDGLRTNDLLRGTNNEFMYKEYFEKVFEDTENRYNHLSIYKVPDIESSTIK